MFIADLDLSNRPAVARQNHRTGANGEAAPAATYGNRLDRTLNPYEKKMPSEITLKRH